MNPTEKPLTVLLVEADEPAAQTIRDMLGSAYRFRVTLETVGRLESALERIAQGGVDVVLLDSSLPDAEGIEGITRFTTAAPNLPTIVLADPHDQALVLRLAHEQKHIYLLKGNFDECFLCGAIARAIERSRLLSLVQQRETELQTSRAQLQAILESSSDGILLVDRDGTVLLANPTAERMLGAEPDNLVGPLFDRPLTPGTKSEERLAFDDGRAAVIAMDVRETDWQDRQVYLVSLHDITQRKQTEEMLRRHRDELELLVYERTADLAKANEELKSAIARLELHDRERSKFIVNVSHELRTPLASMCYAIENLLGGVVGPVPENVLSYLQMFKEDCERLTRTVNDILDLSRIESKVLKLHRVPLPFFRIVQHMVDCLRVQAEAKHQTLIVNGREDVGFVECDPQKIERVVMNVLHNAIKYTPEEGKIEVSVGPDPADSKSLCFDVTDNGIGIPPGYLPRVTERYFRIGEQPDGAGLGLAIVKELVELHEGHIEVVSPPPSRERGTLVSIRLPKATPSTVLVVDDDEAARGLLVRQLASQGYQVLAAGNASEVEATLRSSTPDVMIVDLIMPGMDGITLIARIKSDAELRHIPVVAITGGDLDRTRSEILQGFSIPALRKPWPKAELLNRVEEALIGRHYFDH
ncbi:MAG: response regulator [Kiritimatiellia bacterium]